MYLHEVERELLWVDEAVGIGVNGLVKTSKDPVSVQLALHEDAPAGGGGGGVGGYVCVCVCVCV